MDQIRKRYLLEQLVAALCAERGIEGPSHASIDELWSAFRALVNTRPPRTTSSAWLGLQDELLGDMIAEKGIASVADTTPSPTNPQLRLWRGDITTLAADAIVNAANSQMLGCWAPGHHCIDNAIHTFAGVQLRAECARIMSKQGHEEPTGTAKITAAYNLPARHVIHTVGPIANGRPTARHRAQLASCYRSCLDLAEKSGLSSIAFCCISTGIFGFPQDEAATVAVRSVRTWLAEHNSDITVVFNVFSTYDEQLYRKLLLS